MSQVIVLKHLAREFGLNPPMMRRVLRKKFGYHKRWQWKDNDPELAKIRQYLSLLHSKKQLSSPASSDEISTRSSSTTRVPNSTATKTLH